MQTCADRLGERFQVDPSQILDKFAAIYRSVPYSEQPPFPGVEAVCLKVSASGGINLIVTHRSRLSLEKLLEFHDLMKHFSEFLSAQDGYPHKPDPAMFNALIQKFGLQPSETMAIGDRDLDIQAGKAAGLMTCGFGDHDFQSVPDIRISRMNELLTYIKPTEKNIPTNRRA